MANVQKIISSDPSISTVEHGLSEVGKEQVSASAKLFTQNYFATNQFPQPVAIYSRYGASDRYARFQFCFLQTVMYVTCHGLISFSYFSLQYIYSDFTRARETATLFANTLLNSKIPLYHPPHQLQKDLPGFQLDIRLRERYFGDWNGKSDSHYQDVWDHDCHDANHQEYNCESVNSVVSRTTDLIIDIEQELQKDHPQTSFQVILVAHGDVLQILQTAFLKVDGRVHRSLDHLETATVRQLVLKDSDY